MKGRHPPAGPPRPESDGTTTRPALPDDVRDGNDANGYGGHEDDAGRGRLAKKAALWTGLALCIAFIAWAAWGFLQFDHDIDHPREGGFSWLAVSCRSRLRFLTRYRSRLRAPRIS